jgi:hypothetical protein
MSGTQVYHGVPQPFRIQKRLVLNQCFKSIQAVDRLGGKVNYVTFGGEDLYDVMDLVAVFDIRQMDLSVVSYEEDTEVAGRARSCPVAANLSRISTITVEIVPTVFFENAKPLRTLRPRGRFIYYLDDTRTFRQHHSHMLLDLLRSGLLKEGDFILVTSCLTPRVVNQTRFMGRMDGTFRTFFGASARVDQQFKVRNHVDLLVALAFSRYQSIKPRSTSFLRATLLRKFRYNDTRAAMGLWLFCLASTADRSLVLKDTEFEEFPEVFVRVPDDEDDIPNIFDD